MEEKMSPIMAHGEASFDPLAMNLYSEFLERNLEAEWQESKFRKKLINQKGAFLHKEDGWTFRKFYLQVGKQVIAIPYDYSLSGNRHGWGCTIAEFTPLHEAHNIKTIIVHEAKLKNDKIIYDRLLKYDLRKINFRLVLMCYGKVKY